MSLELSYLAWEGSRNRRDSRYDPFKTFSQSSSASILKFSTVRACDMTLLWGKESPIRSKKLYAVKQVKLLYSTGDLGAFERQVACVLRDVEVMSSLARHNNILNIFGYGWNIERNGPIPFLVTEFAAEGTLRSFLKNNNVSLHEKLLFCKDVAQGLHALHVSGVAHGDLKLDNVLATPYIASSATPLQQNLFEASRTSGLSACISDFGHSLHLYDDEGDSKVKQRYGGTLAYNAPEILGERRHARDNVNFRKCDVWSFGMLCWEVIIDGHAYYHNSDVQQVITSQQRSSSNSTGSSSYSPTQTSSTSILEELTTIASQLVEIACRDVSKRVDGMLSSGEIDRLLFLFRKCLQSDPEKRLVDIPLLPLLSKHDIKIAPQQLQDFTGNSWSFEIFEIASLVPQQVRALILSDCQNLADEPGDSIVSARAAFQLALAHASGLAGSKDLVEAIYWFERSSAKGFRLAELYLPSLRAAQGEEQISHEESNRRFLRCNQQALREKFSTSVSQALADASAKGHREILSIDTLENYASKPGNKSLNSEFLMASKLGKPEIVNWFLDHSSLIGLSSTDNEGCTALHWLFMFAEHEIFRISDKLGDTYADFIYDGEINDAIVVTPSAIHAVAMNNRSLNIDPQLPLQLAGTPLSFAVATCCKTAVRALLLLGANPLLGTGPLSGNPSVENFSAVHIAARLHMADSLGLLLNHICHRHLLSPAAFNRLLDGLSLSVATSTSIERSIIHGSHTKQAVEKTIAILQEFHDMFGHDLRALTLLMPAVVRADLELCSTILAAKACEQTSTATFRAEELDALIIECTQAACLVGSDISLSTRILEFGISVGASAGGMFPDRRSRKPVFVAIEHHQSAILDWLIDVQHVDLNVLDEHGFTPLYAIIDSGFSTNYSITKLIQNGALPQTESSDQRQAIDFVMTDTTISEFTTLLQYVNPGEIQRLLEKAISTGNTEIVTAVVEHGKHSGSASDLNLQSALFTASRSSSANIVQILLQAGANPGNINITSCSPLHQAALFGHAKVLEILHKAGADVNKLDPEMEGGSPLICAVMAVNRGGNTSTGARECCDYLLENGADVNCADGNGNTPMSTLLKGRLEALDPASVEEYSRNIADLRVTNSQYRTIIPHYAEVVDFELIEKLMTHRVQIDKIDSRGHTILHNCARLATGTTVNECQDSKLYRLAERLLEAGADPHRCNFYEETPLGEATYSDNGPVTLAILKHLKSSIGISRPAQYPASSYESPSIVFRRKMMPLEGEGEYQEYFLRSVSRKTTTLEDKGTQAPSREAEALVQTWRKAIYFGSWSSVCAFIRTGTYGPTEYMTIKAALALFIYAIQNDISDTIIKFVGDGETQPDLYLSTIWGLIRKNLRPHGHLPSVLTPKPVQALDVTELMKEGWRAISGHGSIHQIHLAIQAIRKKPKSVEEQIVYEDAPEKFKHHVLRLQYMDSIGGYSRFLPAEYLFATNVYELSGEGKPIPDLRIEPVLKPSILFIEEVTERRTFWQKWGIRTPPEELPPPAPTTPTAPILPWLSPEFYEWAPFQGQRL
ncbi:MAG: hypothetical protein M1820_009494 [Bogoriella megaspora]|nr:MAG: hypothetical protein M1820_009494 [Bogoriella megaspora]